MSNRPKTDNDNLAAKLALRRHFLRRYHTDGSIDVMDCCMGSGVIWQALRREFDITSYWGVDVKVKSGRLQVESERILAQPGWPQNVIDVDTSGSPWKHWAALLPYVVRPVTVFLTIGQIKLGGLCKVVQEAFGFGDLVMPGPLAIKATRRILVPYMLAMASRLRVDVVYAAEAPAAKGFRYVGVLLAPTPAA